MNAIEEGGVFHECHVKNSQRWLVSQMGLCHLDYLSKGRIHLETYQ